MERWKAYDSYTNPDWLSIDEIRKRLNDECK
jgi:hypothetical protein